VTRRSAIRLELRLDAGDLRSVSTLFSASSELPPGVAALERSGQDAAPSALPSAAVVIEPRSVALAGAVSCAQFVSAEFAVVNNSGSSVDYTLQFPAMVAPLAMTVVGGSIAGVVTDANFDGAGGLTTTGSDPLYQGLVDSSPVSGGRPVSGAISLPGSGSFTAAGQTEALPAASFGLPGPTGAGPPLMSTIAIEFAFTLGAGDGVRRDCPFRGRLRPYPHVDADGDRDRHRHRHRYRDTYGDRDRDCHGDHDCGAERRSVRRSGRLPVRQLRG
jgi:hypothetical protein